MTWNDPEKPDKSDIELEEEMHKENAFSGWQKNKQLGLFADLISSPFVWGGTAIIVFIILLVIFWPNSNDMESSEKMETIVERLDMLENRISVMETNFQGLSNLQPQEQNLESFQNRIEQLEAFVKHRTDQLTSELQKAQKKISTMESKPSTSVTKSKPEPAQKSAPVKKKDTARYHTVKEGETLYRISLNNDITVDRLLELNNLPKDAVIRPGQKLKVSP